MDVYVFDGDDTLWMNEWQYSQAFAEFFHFLYVTLGPRMPNLKSVQSRYFEIESELFTTWGVKRGRVAQAMQLLYEDLCRYIESKYGVNPCDPAHLAEIKRIGDLPFDYEKIEWLPGVKDALKKLRAGGHRICFLSSYDRSLFPGRAEFLGLYDVFPREHVHITEHAKKKDDFIVASGWSDEERQRFGHWFAVGNGESDIRPALNISEQWKGIYIPHGSTSALFSNGAAVTNFTPPPFNHPRVITIGSLLDLSQRAS